MKIKSYLQNLENGQVLPIVVLAILALIAMAALLVDGGALMANRRTAQAAADAGALAGATELCLGDQNPVSVALDYAIDKNGATTASATLSGNEITVNTTVEHPSFFARILGRQTLEASAEAVASCSPPSMAVHPIPIAFFYNTQPGKGESDECTEDGVCQLVFYDLYELLDELMNEDADLPLDNFYIVSDNTRICHQETGDLICVEMDKNSGGGGNRTWLDLSPLKKPPAAVNKMIEDGLDAPLIADPRIWVNTGTGAITAGYKYIYGLDPLEGYESLPVRLIYVPLFDRYCVKNTKANCAEPGDDFIRDWKGNDAFKDNSSAYRITGFAAFLVTCVTDANSCDPRGGCVDGVCPGYAFSNPEPGDTNAMEGYFVNGFDPDLSGLDGSDAGLYLITLKK